MISARWPFDVRKLPFFYGWVIWLVSTLGFLFSIPGQTMGMAVFTDPFIEVLGLSRTQLSLAYLFGTMGSSLFLTAAGRWYDRLGGRLMIAVSSLALGAMVFYISLASDIADLLGGGTTLSFIVILLGYFGVRFFGQGVLTSASRNVLLVWFVKRRGLVSGIRGVFVSLGFSLAPLVIAYLILQFGWQGALWTMALVVGCGFSIFALILVRDNPSACGVLPDGDDGEVARSEIVEVQSLTLSEARRSPIFWVNSLSLAMHSLFGTALTFHVVSIFEEAGRGREEAFGYFFPAAIFSTSVNLVASWLADSNPLKPFLIAMLGCFLAGATGLYFLAEEFGFWLLAAGFGAGGGLWGVISNLAFIRYFGPLHLGEISGFNTSLTVFASAIGPAAFSLGLDWSGGYGQAVRLCIAVLIVLFVASILIRQEELE